MSVSPLISPHPADAVAEARVQPAAAHRLAVLHELEEGIDNHFTMTVPGREGEYLILPFGLHWSEARASDLIVFDEQGGVLEGRGSLELSAQCIHAPIHRPTGTRVDFGACAFPLLRLESSFFSSVPGRRPRSDGLTLHGRLRFLHPLAYQRLRAGARRRPTRRRRRSPDAAADDTAGRAGATAE
jgi:hypothetical protein